MGTSLFEVRASSCRIGGSDRSERCKAMPTGNTRIAGLDMHRNASGLAGPVAAGT